MSEFVGDRIRALRLKQSLTFMQLAVKAGIGLTTVQLAEHAGVVTPRTAALLAPVLGCRAEEILPKPRKPRA